MQEYPSSEKQISIKDILSELELTDEDILIKEKKAASSTERVRRYYKRHPEKVKKYLRKTVKDRVARNRDRRDAVDKYGESRMKNHDVHHPDGPKKDNWQLAPKDHGRDTVDMHKQKLVRKRKNAVATGKVFKKEPAKTPEKTPEKEKKTPRNVTFKAHTFKNLSLSFLDIHNILSRGLGEMLGMGENITERIKSYDITITVKDKKLFILQNKSDIKDVSAAGVSSNAFIENFDGPEDAKTAVAQALVDLERMLRNSDVGVDLLDSVFDNGSKSMKVDIYYNKEEQVTPQGKNILVFNDVVSFDEDYKQDKLLANGSKAVAHAVIMSQYSIDPAKVKNIAFSDSQQSQLESQIKKISGGLDAAASAYNMTFKNNLRDYLVQVCDKLLSDLVSENNIELSPYERKEILYRWVDNEPFNLDTLGKERKSAIREYETEALRDDVIENMKEIQSVILKGAVFVIQRINNTLVANIPNKKKIINQEAIKSVNQLNEAFAEGKDVMEQLQVELRRLQNIELETQSVVFYYNNQFFLFGTDTSLINASLDIIKSKVEATAPVSRNKKKVTKSKNQFKGILSKLFAEKTKIFNPVTKKEILLKTALGYGEKRNPAVFNAAKLWLVNHVKGITSKALNDPNIAVLRRKRPQS